MAGSETNTNAKVAEEKQGADVNASKVEGGSETNTNPTQESTKEISTINTNTRNFSVAEQEIITKVKALLEFYFGDSNLGRDRFLRKILETDPGECMLLLSSRFSSHLTSLSPLFPPKYPLSLPSLIPGPL
jgi:hypothetical protein